VLLDGFDGYDDSQRALFCNLHGEVADIRSEIDDDRVLLQGDVTGT